MFKKVTTNISCRFEDIFLSQISFRIRIINSRHFCPLPIVVAARVTVKPTDHRLPTDQTHRLKYSIFELFSKTHRTEPQTQKYYIIICQLNLLKPTDMKLIRDKYLPFVYTFS